jgi:hypothetical protein
VKDNKGLTQIEAKLDTVIKLMALSIVSDRDPLQENALKLQRAGLGPKEIAALCGTTPNTVSVALSNAKHLGKSRRIKTR